MAAMSSLDDIAVYVEEDVAVSSTPSGQVLAIVTEIESMLSALVENGKTDSIDIRSLPMMPGDYESLKKILGEGEVSATVQALGPTQIQETGIHGVWWVTHYNSDDEVMAEFIEVSQVPAIVNTDKEDIKEGCELLQQRIREIQNTDS
jgi:hydrogenase-1 operon protein HyaF